MGAGDLGRVADVDVRRVADRVDQVLGHARRERRRADEDRDLLGVAGEMQGRLPGRVPAADDIDVLAGERLRLRHRRAVVHARSLEVDGAWRVEPPVLDAEGENDRSRGDLGSVVAGADDEAARTRREPDRAVGDLRARAEEPRLLVGPLGELPAAEPAWKAEIVADQRARARLTTDPARVEDGRPQPFRGGVDRGSQPCGACADDDEIGVVCLELGREAARSSELGSRRIDENGAVGERDRWRVVSNRRLDSMRYSQSCERRLQLVRAPRAWVGDHDRTGRALALQPGRLLQKLRDRPVEDLVRSPRGAEDVQVDPAVRHRAQHEAAQRTIRPAEPGDQQPAPCGREACADACEQLGAALAHCEADGDVVAVCVRPVERRLQLGDRAPADGVVAAVAPAELVDDTVALDLVVVGDHEQRLAGRGGHGASAPILRAAGSPRTSSR